MRWSLQRGYVRLPCCCRRELTYGLRYAPLPKSANPARVVSNAAVFDFELSGEDVSRIDALDKGKEGTITWNPVDVD